MNGEKSEPCRADSRYEKYHSFHGGDKDARKANYTDMVRSLYFSTFLLLAIRRFSL